VPGLHLAIPGLLLCDHLPRNNRRASTNGTAGERRNGEAKRISEAIAEIKTDEEAAEEKEEKANEDVQHGN